MRKTWKVIKTILFIILILLLINCIIQKIMGSHHPQILGYSFGIVMSESMEPNLPTGSFIIIKEQIKYQIDDFLTYNHDSGKSVTHRLVKIENDNLITKGDANKSSDPPISIDDVYGKVICQFSMLWILIPLLLFSFINFVYAIVSKEEIYAEHNSNIYM
jgi:signal peptidase